MHLAHPLQSLVITALVLQLLVLLLTTQEPAAPKQGDGQNDEDVEQDGPAGAPEWCCDVYVELCLVVAHRAVVVHHSHTQRVVAVSQRHEVEVRIQFRRTPPLVADALKHIVEPRGVVYLAAGAGQLYGELVLVAQVYTLTDMKCLVEDDTSVHLLADGHVLVGHHESTEHGELLRASLAHAGGVQHVETALSANQQQPALGKAC